MFWLTSVALIFLGIIAFQDLKQYAVTWVLFPLLAIVLGFVNYSYVLNTYFFWSVSINCIIVSLILTLLIFYSKIKLKQPFKAVFGLGDALFFYAFALGFPSISFVVLFVFSILFSLGIHLILNLKTKEKRVPLAGFMSIFLILALVIDILLPSISLYNY